MKERSTTMTVDADAQSRKVLRDVVRTQALRHLVANKLTLPLTILRCLRDGQPVPQRLFHQAVRDLEAIIRGVDRQITKK